MTSDDSPAIWKRDDPADAREYDDPTARESDTRNGAATRSDGGRRSELDRGTLFDLLSSTRRRHVVRYLLRTGGEVPFGELTDRVAALEAGTTVEALTDDERKPVYVSLRQTHLPRLHEASVVRYDPDQGTISPTARLADLVPPLRAVDEVLGADPALPLPDDVTPPLGEESHGCTAGGSG
jgi:hypothetical protein